MRGEEEKQGDGNESREGNVMKEMRRGERAGERGCFFCCCLSSTIYCAEIPPSTNTSLWGRANYRSYYEWVRRQEVGAWAT